MDMLVPPCLPFQTPAGVASTPNDIGTLHNWGSCVSLGGRESLVGGVHAVWPAVERKSRNEPAETDATTVLITEFVKQGSESAIQRA